MERFLQGILHGTVAVIALLRLCQQIFIACKSVQQKLVRCRITQILCVMLGMNIDQLRNDLLYKGNRCRALIDPRNASSLPGYLTCNNQQAVLTFMACILQLLQHAVLWGKFKNAFNDSLVTALLDHVAVNTISLQNTDGIH